MPHERHLSDGQWRDMTVDDGQRRIRAGQDREKRQELLRQFILTLDDKKREIATRCWFGFERQQDVARDMDMTQSGIAHALGRIKAAARRWAGGVIKPS